MPTPLGCFKDFESHRDLTNLIGTDLTIEECIVQAKYAGYKYIGL